MIHTLSQLPALGEWILALLLATVFVAVADELQSRFQRGTFVRQLMLLYFKIGRVAVYVCGLGVLASAALNLLRLVGVL
jgi:hypothetical protein